MTDSYRKAFGLRRLHAGGAKTDCYRKALGLRRLHAVGAKTDGYRKAARHSALSSFSSAWKAEENDEAHRGDAW